MTYGLHTPHLHEKPASNLEYKIWRKRQVMLLVAGARMKSVILEEANGPNLKTESPDDEEDDGYRKRETIMRTLQEFSSSSC